jgi:uncharacterized protein YbjQ (UPF0145 family)
MVELVSFATLVVIGFIVGTLLEQRHFASIRRREAELLELPTIATDEIDPSRRVDEAILVVGVAVVSVDYFKVVAASVASFFGARITAYETLLDRARRESILRMKEQAKGFDLIINTRLETSALGSEHDQRNKIHSVECFSYGTAVRYAPIR